MTSLSRSLFCTLLFTSLAAFGQMPTGANDPLSSKLEGQTFKANLKSGFHFNETAPNFMKVDDQQIKPKTLTKQTAEFALPSVKFKSAKVSLYVCDDAMTFCQPRTIQLGAEGKPETVEAPAPAPNKKAAVNSHGFIEDDLQQGLAQAKKEKKLVLVDFSARWCPGCMRLETETFDTPEFKKKTKGFVKVRIDVDRFENSFVKGKYKFHSIPTVIALTTDGKEITRFIDFQPMSTISDFLDSVQKTPQSFEDLKIRADSGDKKATESFGKRLSMADQFEESLPYLKKIAPPPVELLNAEVNVAKNKFEADSKSATLKAEYISVLKKSIQTEPKSTRSIIWRTSLIPLLDEKDPTRKTLYSEGVALADELLSADHAKLLAAFAGELIGEFYGYETLLLASDRADLVEVGDTNPDNVLKAKKRVAEIGRAFKIPTSRLGPSMRYLIFLVGAKDFAEAETLSKELLKKDQNNAEIQRRLIGILNEEGKFTEGIQVGKSCLPHSYGMNEVWAARQLAKAYAGANQKEEAKKLLISYLERDDIYWSSMKKEHKTFEDLLKSL